MNARILMAAAVLCAACSTETLDYTVGVSPAAVTVTTGKTIHLGALSKGDIAWSVLEANGGTVTTDGTYTAPATPGTYHVVATSTKDSKKSATVTVTVVPAAQKPEISVPRLVTAGKTATATVPAVAGVTFTWSIFGGTISGANTGTSVTFSSPDPGEVVLTCNATNGAGDASGEGIAVVSILQPAATPVIIAPIAVTTGRTGLTASVQATPGITYKWTIGNGSPAGASTGASYGFTAGTVGTLSLGVTASNAAGDPAAPASASVDVRPAGLELVAGALGGRGNLDGTGDKARFDNPQGVGVDSAGNTYVADSNNRTVRKIAPDGTVTTLAGKSGETGNDDGPGADARFYYPLGLTASPAGTVYVSDQDDNRIRSISPGGVVSTISGTGNYGTVDGDQADSQYQSPAWLALAPDGGELWEFENGSFFLRKLVPNPDGGPTWLVSTESRDAGVVSGLAVHPGGSVFMAKAYESNVIASHNGFTNIAGQQGSSGYTDGPGEEAFFASLGGIAFDPASGSFYVGDNSQPNGQANHMIRRLDFNAESGGWDVATAAGSLNDAGPDDGPALTGGRVDTVAAIAAKGDGSIVFTDSNQNVVRKLAAGLLSTIAGAATRLGVRVEGPGPSARFEEARGLVVGADGTTYVSDDHYIRAISPAGVVSTFAGAGSCCFNHTTARDGLAGSATFDTPGPLAVDQGNHILYVADENSDGGFRRPTLIRAVTYEPEFGADVVTTIAGDRESISCTNDDHGETTLDAGFCGVQAMAVDSHGRIFFNESTSSPSRIRMLERTADGGGFAYTTLATGNNCNSDRPTGRAADPIFADFCNIGGMAADSQDRIFFTDDEFNMVRVLEMDGGFWSITAVAGTFDECGSNDGESLDAGFCHPGGLAFDRHGTLWVADSNNRTIRKLTHQATDTWKVETPAGNPVTHGVRTGPLPASLGHPLGLSVTPWGDLALLDQGENSILLLRPPEP